MWVLSLWAPPSFSQWVSSQNTRYISFGRSVSWQEVYVGSDNVWETLKIDICMFLCIHSIETLCVCVCVCVCSRAELEMYYNWMKCLIHGGWMFQRKPLSSFYHPVTLSFFYFLSFSCFLLLCFPPQPLHHSPPICLFIFLFFFFFLSLSLSDTKETIFANWLL